MMWKELAQLHNVDGELIMPELTKECTDLALRKSMGLPLDGHEHCHECGGTNRILKYHSALNEAALKYLQEWGWQVTLWVNGDVTIWDFKRQITKPDIAQVLMAAMDFKRK